MPGETLKLVECPCRSPHFIGANWLQLLLLPLAIMLMCC